MNNLVRRELVSNILGHSIHDDNDYREASRLLYSLPVIQEVPIDKIKAEIEKMSTNHCGGYIGLDKQEVLKVIDKYTEENTNE